MTTERGRITHQQQLAPCAGHANVHAADVGEESDLALRVAARQRDGNDVALLALKRIDGAHAEPAAQRRRLQPPRAEVEREVHDGCESPLGLRGQHRAIA